MAGTGGIVSSGDEKDDEMEDDDEEDYIGEDKRLMEDVKITADDVVIVASFKLPISVYKDQQTGQWKVRPSRSMLYPTLFKVREKKKMIKIICLGWPGVVPKDDRESAEITEVLRQYGCYPVFLS